MSVESEDCGITTLPQATVDSMWMKALEYVLSSSDVVAAPHGDPKAKVVSSRSSTSPHYVQALASGQYELYITSHHWLYMVFLLVVDKREELPKGNGVKLNLEQKLVSFVQPLVPVSLIKLVPLLLYSPLTHYHIQV